MNNVLIWYSFFLALIFSSCATTKDVKIKGESLMSNLANTNFVIQSGYNKFVIVDSLNVAENNFTGIIRKRYNLTSFKAFKTSLDTTKKIVLLSYGANSKILSDIESSNQITIPLKRLKQITYSNSLETNTNTARYLKHHLKRQKVIIIDIKDTMVVVNPVFTSSGIYGDIRYNKIKLASSDVESFHISPKKIKNDKSILTIFPSKSCESLFQEQNGISWKKVHRLQYQEYDYKKAFLFKTTGVLIGVGVVGGVVFDVMNDDSYGGGASWGSD